MQCTICLGTPKLPTFMACCGNQFCRQCIDQWVQFRSVCPLCCAEIDQLKVNVLKKRISDEVFDDGSLVLEGEINELNKRSAYIVQKICHKRQQYECSKSLASTSLMTYLEEQMQIVKHFDIEMRHQNSINNRAKTVEAMQLLIEAISNIQTAFEHNSVEVQAEFQDESQYYDDDTDLYEFDDYQVVKPHSKKNCKERVHKSHNEQK